MRRSPEVKEWIRKAEEDFISALVLARKRNPPLSGNVCFHCQQAAEKYLKGYLANNDISFPKTHDLVSLKDLASGRLPEIEFIVDLLKYLNRFASVSRYPGEDATVVQARRALKAAREVRAFFASRLPGISR